MGLYDPVAIAPSIYRGGGAKGAKPALALLTLLMLAARLFAADAVKGVPRPHLMLKHAHRVTALLFLPDNRTLVTSSFRTLRLTDLRTGKADRMMTHHWAVNSLVASSRGKFLAAGTNFGDVRLLGLPTLVLRNVTGITRWSIYAVAVSPDASLLAACAADGTVALRSLKEVHVTRSLGTKGERMAALAFSPDGKRLAALSRYGRCDVWDVASGDRLATSARVGGESGRLRFGADGHMLAIVSGGAMLYLWDLRQAAPVAVKAPDELIGGERVNGVGLLPEGGRPMNAPVGDFIWGATAVTDDLRTAASQLENGKIALWDVATRKVLYILPAGRMQPMFVGTAARVVFSPNGAFLAVADHGGRVDVWQLRGEPVAPVEGVIDADVLPFAWGEPLDGLRSRLVLAPVKPSAPTQRERHVGEGRAATSEGVWWEVRLQLRNETEQDMRIVWPEFSERGGFVVSDADGHELPHYAEAERHLNEKPHAIKLQPGTTYTMGAVVLGRFHDMARPGTYRICFPQTHARQPAPNGLTHSVLPASNTIEFTTER